MADFGFFPADIDLEPDSENWKQILSRDEYQIPDTTKEIIRGHCQSIERIYQQQIKFGLHRVEGELRKVKLYIDYAYFGQRLLNEAGKTDWNGVEEMLEGILNEIQKTNNGVFGWKLEVFGWDLEASLKARQGVEMEIEQGSWNYPASPSPTLARLRLKLAKEGLIRATERHIPAGKRPKQDSVIQIKAETVEGKEVILEQVHKHVYIRDVRDEIATKLGRDRDKIILMHQGTALKISKRFGFYEITNGTTINVLPRSRGKGVFRSARDAFENAKNMAIRFVKWIPAIIADTTRAVTEIELVRISQLIGNGWEIFGGILGITQVKIEHIKADNQTMATRILSMLITWRNDINNEATVGKLYQAMNECKSVHFEKDEIKLILSDVCPC